MSTGMAALESRYHGKKGVINVSFESVAVGGHFIRQVERNIEVWKEDAEESPAHAAAGTFRVIPADVLRTGPVPRSYSLPRPLPVE
jgi:hypothetical protein